MNNPKLVGCHPQLEPLVDRVLAAMAALGYPMVVTDGKRSSAQQQALFAKGRTTPGPVVTNCDGIVKPSNHQSGRAADCAFIIDGKPSWDHRLPWRAYGACVVACGGSWGGDWKGSLVDLPHAEVV